ncbi:uncharacterized protein CTRU02_211278 [Colletotrichum truncatum]|uniref:Uncharacterized protein n=1 Tax=Colletotrichum truncatum TaxID=5467 RepID=A0ACC3YRD0_COLTU|nr:uncharacterized protein CTRU02_02054 [Colletotrichum truncatum]KAF6799183.1 hypothetical protein CTRU02_02054 [Colletotrichum truncatum]
MRNLEQIAAGNSPGFSNEADGLLKKKQVNLWDFTYLLKTWRYSPIEDSYEQDNSEKALALDLKRKNVAIWRWRLISAVLAASLVITWLVLPLAKQKSRYPQPDEGTENVLKWMKQAEVAEGHYWCGPSTAEAKKRGCTFDKLHNRWMSPHCETDFEPSKSAVLKALDGDLPEFVFYRDDDGKPGTRMTDDELNYLDILTPAWTTVGHHMVHCMYMLLQAAAALNLGTKADMVVHAFEHAGHCASVILNVTKTAPGWHDVSSFGHTQSGVCW